MDLKSLMSIIAPEAHPHPSGSNLYLYNLIP